MYTGGGTTHSIGTVNAAVSQLSQTVLVNVSPLSLLVGGLQFILTRVSQVHRSNSSARVSRMSIPLEPFS